MRVFIRNPKARQFLIKYTTDKLDSTEFKELKALLKVYQPALLPLMQSLQEGEKTEKCPGNIKDFVKAISSNYPVCQLIHYNEKLIELLKKIGQGYQYKNSESIILMENCPVVFRFLETMDESSDIVGPIISALANIALAPYNSSKEHNVVECKNCNCYNEGLGYFPTLPKVHHRGEYVLDNKNSIGQTKCTKRGSRHPTLSPGLFTLSCKHGICYGFHLMESVESPNVPFTILKTRFPSAPKLIIYDNACSLANYALNRDPHFFKHCWFLCDRFHWKNHVGCHCGYDLASYPQFSAMNTQVAEQRNSTLKKLKSMLSYMNVDNYIQHCKLFMWFRSMITITNSEKGKGKDLNVPYFELFKGLSAIYSRTSS